MVEHRLLVEVCVFCIMTVGKEVFTQFQHVVTIAALRSIGVIDIVRTVSHGKEMLVNTVSSESQSAVLCHVGPKILSSLTVLRHNRLVSSYTIFLCNALKTNVFWHLCIRVSVVKKGGAVGLEPSDHCLMTVFLGCCDIFCISCYLVGIEDL